MMTPIETAAGGTQGYKRATLLTNLAVVAHDVGRPAEYLLAFLAKRRNAPALRGKFALKGEHPVRELQALVFEFIDTLVMCTQCRKPDTELEVTNQNVRLVCLGCGKRSAVRSAHPIFKLILKHPPTVSAHSLRPKRDNDAADGADQEGDGGQEDDDDDQVFSLGTSKAEVAARACEVLSGAVAGIMGREAAGAVFGDLAVRADPSVLLGEARRLGCESQAVELMVQSLITDRQPETPEALLHLLAQSAPRLRPFVDQQDARAAVRHQRSLLRALEELLLSRPALTAATHAVLYRLYFEPSDGDRGENLGLVSEDAVLQWAAEPPSTRVGAVRQRAQPFLDWLQRADDPEEN